MTRLSERITAARRRAFVGRDEELAVFGRLLAPGASEAVLFVHGPGGTGKSTLLRQFGFLAEDAGRQVVWLDGRDPITDVTAEHAAVLVDNAELVDVWLREELLPALGDDVVVAIAGREPPSVAFRTDPGWRSVLRTIRLTNLDRETGRALLRLRGVPDSEHDQALEFTHGHPLALALLADVCAQSDIPNITATPEVLNTLLRSLIGSVPTPRHLTALEACSQVLVATEPLLAALLDVPDAREIFDWLRELSIVDYAPRGLVLHDFVRETLATELRWRQPETYSLLHQRARAYYQQQFPAQQSVLLDFAFLHRDSPMLGPYLRHVNATADDFTVTRTSAQDWAKLRRAIETHEGRESAAQAERWYTEQPQSVSVIRNGDAVGLVIAPMIGDTLWVTHWMALDTHQAVSPVQMFITLHLVRRYLTTPGLGQVNVTCLNPDFWTEAFRYTDFHRLPGEDFSRDGKHFGVFGHDWRAVPPMTWMTLLADRENADDLPDTPRPLSEAEFAAAVRDALRDFTRPDRLRDAPLGRDAIARAARVMEASPRDRRAFRVLHHTYLQPAETQAAAAELLDLPMTTYRRHLAAGVARITEILWQEIGLKVDAERSAD
ncbi:ATP-binding protein [Lentzea tibetensis]|uniref:ATP-binding protein n=1 Tax=Lentzea tibetensis TaxID=2591470 RepID=UPI0016473254|nr:ATP-binding protein [Lentzea tibetensis]